MSRLFTRRQTVTHPSTNRARRRVTSLITTNALSSKHYTTPPSRLNMYKMSTCVVYTEWRVQKTSRKVIFSTEEEKLLSKLPQMFRVPMNFLCNPKLSEKVPSCSPEITPAEIYPSVLFLPPFLFSPSISFSPFPLFPYFLPRFPFPFPSV